MSADSNTLFLRLTGPMQSWGTCSPLQLRRTDPYPSKSGVLGLLLCAMGVRREQSARELDRLADLAMGVRVDRCGTTDWDYHTVGAGIGIRSAEGRVKKTEKTGEFETLLSRRQYLYDASFLVALRGPTALIEGCAEALKNPVWPVYLGRKSCIPAEPVFAGLGVFDTPSEALASVSWTPGVGETCREETHSLKTCVEHLPGTPPPKEARLVYDVPRVLGFYAHGPRWVVPGEVTVPVAPPVRFGTSGSSRRVDYVSSQWKRARTSRLERDNHLCVFCKAPAEDVHHVDYANVGRETDADLRSLCRLCHDACTILEYGRDMRAQRVDPADPALRPMILRQVDRLLRERRPGRRRSLLEAARNADAAFFGDVPASWAKEGS